jgi:hypothetical protein
LEGQILKQFRTWLETAQAQAKQYDVRSISISIGSAAG